jgi:hypothetical protein
MSCGNNNPLAKVKVRSDATVWKASSADGKVTAYLLRSFQGGATGDSIYEIVVADAESDEGLRILRADLNGPPTSLEIEWTNDILHIRYGRAVIWEFTNGYPYGNGDSARTYEVVLERK